MRKTTHILLAIAWTLLLASGPSTKAEPINLYDGTLRSMPNQQGWVYLLDPPVRNQSRQVLVDRATNLNTVRNFNDHAGYFARVPILGTHPRLPDEFNRERGYQVGFTVQLPTENHVRPDRAGFSVIVTSRDLMGIELGFWTDEVFGQSVDFIHSEGNANLPFNIATEYVDFVLEIQGDEYRLSANGSDILTGPLRDYSGFGTPYDISDFIFFGDDTTSASASVNIRSIWIDTELAGTEPPPGVEPEPTEPEPEPEPPIEGTDAVFTVDPEASSISVSGTVLGSNLESQGDGALTTMFDGEIHTVISESTIAFTEASRIDAAPNGDWSPLAGGAAGKAPADFGAKATVLIATADAAARNIEFAITSGAIALADDGAGFPVSGMTFAIPAESTAAVDIAAGGLIPLRASQTLADLSGENTSSDAASIVTENNIQTINIPVAVKVSFRVATPNDATLNFTGNIVASREIPVAPSEPIEEPLPPVTPGPTEPEPPVPPLPPVVVEPDTPPTVGISLAAGGEITVNWDAIAGRTYQLEASSNLVDWTPFGEPVVAESADGTWTGSTADGINFYRIVLQAAN